MLQYKISTEREHYRNSLLSTLTQAALTFQSNCVFIESRANAITKNLVNASQIYGTGLTQIYYKGTIDFEKQYEKVIVILSVNQISLAEVEHFSHKFKLIYLVSIDLSTQKNSKWIKLSPLREKIKGFQELSLNFVSYLDRVYQLNDQSIEASMPITDAFTTYLTSFPKFYQFELYFSSKNESFQQEVKRIAQSLNQKLKILERHDHPAYKDSSSSPRMKILLFDRKADLMSGLVYSYLFGPVNKELKMQMIHEFTSVASSLFNQLFTMDLQAAAEFLHSISSSKAKNQKTKFEFDELEKAKAVISSHYDEHTTPKQISIHIAEMKPINQFCMRRAETTVLEQTIVNARSENDQKMSSSKILSLLEKWVFDKENHMNSEQDYMKLAMLSYMVNSFWFFQRKVINAGVPEKYKKEFTNFIKEEQGKHKPLEQKSQGDERFDLYRHEPRIVKEYKGWTAQKESKNWQKVQINKTLGNRQTKVIVYVNGPMGYNEVALLLKEIKEIKSEENISIICDQLMTTNQFMSYLLAKYA